MAEPNQTHTITSTDNTDSKKVPNSIDAAITACNEKIINHRILANRFLFLAIGITILFFAYEIYRQVYENYATLEKFTIASMYRNDIDNLNDMSTIRFSDSLSPEAQLGKQNHLSAIKLQLAAKSLKKIEEEFSKPNNPLTNYIIYGIFILIFSIITSFYRFHQKEISKYEHYLIGFHRIRIAANNSKTGFEDEVKASLTRDAFVFETARQPFSKERKVDSPIPGHPSSDIAALMINKLFESIEVRSKDDKKETN